MGAFGVLFIPDAYDGYFFFEARGESAAPDDVPLVRPVRAVPGRPR